MQISSSAVAAAPVLSTIFPLVMGGSYSGKIIITNPAPPSGTCQTPVWLGVHDGSFDLYDRDQPARPSIEALAEDGNNEPLNQEFAMHQGSTWQTNVGGGPICPSDTVEMEFTFETTGNGPLYLSFATMVLPSNDAWLGNGNPEAYLLIDTEGNFYNQDILQMGSDVLDAGTEDNDELSETTAFFGQTMPNTGTDENGVVTLHEGFEPGGAILSDPRFANADFTVAGYEALKIQVVLDAPPKTFIGKIIITNKAPEYGTCQTPTWVGVHDGSFDLYDRDAPARESIERVAEDGDTSAIMEEFAADKGSNWQGTVGAAPLCPGESVEQNFVFTNIKVGKAYYLSFMSMVIPSNDAWLASSGDPKAYELIDVFGNFQNTVIVKSGDQVLDAGTEVNDEIPEHTAFLAQITPDTGVDENGVVTLHPGFLENGNILSDPRFVNADFTQPNYDMMEIKVILNGPPKRYTGTITVSNRAPIHGTCQTPVWVGIHDGTFDLYDRGAAVRESIELLAEDGINDLLIAEFAEDPGGVWDDVVGGAPLCPGESASLSFDLDLYAGRPLFFSYASMVLPSNDAFIANVSPQACQVVNVAGVPISGSFVVPGWQVLDAGTEVNDEIPENTAFFGQSMPETGTPENGVVTRHHGFLNGGGILDDPNFANADFTAIGYEMIEVRISWVEQKDAFGGRSEYSLVDLP